MPLDRRIPSVLIVAAALVAMVSLPATAQTAPAAPDRVHHPFAHLLRCLAVVNLTDAQKADVKAVFDAAGPRFDALAATLKGDRDALKADLADPSTDPCKVGSDFLKLHADREAMRAFLGSVKDQVLALLTDAQKAKLAGCLEAPPHTATLQGETGGESTE